MYPQGRGSPQPAQDAAKPGNHQRRGRNPSRPPFPEPHAACASLIALSTRGGDIGSSVNRTPIALRTAFAIAAIGGTIGVSPTPRTPYGCLGLGTSTMMVSIIGTSEQTGMR